MKKTLLTLALVATSVAAFAQGRVTFINDTLHAYVIDPVNKFASDPAGPIAGTLPSGITLVAGLYAGTSSTTMTLQAGVTTLNGSGLVEPGAQSGAIVNLSAGITGGSARFFQVAVWDSTFATVDQAFAAGSYTGRSSIFTAIPSTSAISAPSILPGGPSASTWANGPINVALVPEPSSLALAGLGMASLLIFRRRK